MFKYAIGDDGLKVIKSFTYSEAENANDSRVVMGNMEKHCIGDNSQIGLGAALMKNRHSIAYASRALKKLSPVTGKLKKKCWERSVEKPLSTLTKSL